ncbi:hypothetical protein [Deinococcus enclensis]|uniref:Head-tail adaptor protein n=1 Tax=Deinococcus enclensis TaxID=1049582 RepID=A0ABT9ME49_9DEIO|nr:hypothetical protein [Deinococcus enclensis]MDP9764872.1 hypothetical protein [Deinococcus enclensis]
MKLPARMLTTTAQVLTATRIPAGLGQTTTTWQPTGQPIPAAHFPAGEKVIREAQLRAVKVSREAYLQGSVNLSPVDHRLTLDGVTYQITLVQEWSGFTVVGLVS